MAKRLFNHRQAIWDLLNNKNILMFQHHVGLKIIFFLGSIRTISTHEGGFLLALVLQMLMEIPFIFVNPVTRWTWVYAFAHTAATTWNFLQVSTVNWRTYDYSQNLLIMYGLKFLVLLTINKLGKLLTYLLLNDIFVSLQKANQAWFLTHLVSNKN